MITSDKLTEKVEAEYPLPIALTYYKVRNKRYKTEEGQLMAFLGVFEVILKFLTSITIRAYLISGGKDSGINEILKDFSRPTDGTWIKLLRECLSLYRNNKKREPENNNAAIENSPNKLLYQLASFYFTKFENGKNNPAYLAAEKIAITDSIEKTLIKSASPECIFNLITAVRNKGVHKAGLEKRTPASVHIIVENISIILSVILSSLDFLTKYPLYQIEEVTVQRGGDVFIHDAYLWMGTKSERVQLELDTEPINKDELYLIFINDESVNSLGSIKWALSLSPYLIAETCPTCGGDDQIFLFNKLDKNSIVYDSLYCAHKFIPDVRLKEFDDIKSFLEGKTTLKALFKGKSYGTIIDDKLIGITPKSLNDSTELYKNAEEKIRNGDHALARIDLEEAIKINPDHSRAYFLLAMCNIILGGSIDNICRLLNKSIAIDPHNLKFIKAYAEVNIAIDRDKEAICALQKALDADPSDQASRFLLNKIRDKKDLS